MDIIKIKLQVEDARFIKTNGTNIGTVLDATFDTVKNVYITRSNKTNEIVEFHPNLVSVVADADFQETYEKDMAEAKSIYDNSCSLAMTKKRKSQSIFKNEQEAKEAADKQAAIDADIADKKAKEEAEKAEEDARLQREKDAVDLARKTREDNQAKVKAILDTKAQLEKEITDIESDLDIKKKAYEADDLALRNFNEDKEKQSPEFATEHQLLTKNLFKSQQAFENSNSLLSFTKAELKNLPVID